MFAPPPDPNQPTKIKPPAFNPQGGAGPYGGINPAANPQSPVLSKAGMGTPGPYGNGGINPAANPAVATVTKPTATTATPTATATSQPWYTQQDVGSFQNWAKSRYGREATPEELQQIGANSTDMASAQTYADTLAGQQGWTGPTAATPATPGVVSGGGGSEVQAELQKRLLEALGRNTGDVDTTSQEYLSQRGAFDRGQQRQLERAKRAIATRMGGQGGGFEASMQGVDLAAAGQAGDFEAQLATQQIMRQREDLQNALQMAQQGGLATEARQLQDRLGSADLDLRKYLGKGQLGLGLLGTLLSDRQASNALGFNYANLQNSMNQNVIQALLGGL